MTLLLSLSLSLSLVAEAKPPASAPCTTYEPVQYARLASDAFVRDYDGKCITFDANFRGEFTLVQFYTSLAISTEGRVFINHRAPDYQATTVAGFGVSSDSEIPPFPIAVPKANSDFVYSWKAGQVFTVKGKGKLSSGLGKMYLLVSADEVTPVAASERAPVAPTAPVLPPDDLAAKLKQLKDLLDQGLIMQAEYDAKRAELLKGL